LIKTAENIIPQGTELHGIKYHILYVCRISDSLSSNRPTGQEDIDLEIRKRKFRWIGHTTRKEYKEIPKATLLWESSRKQQQRKT
jgi:hypothetical protein